jgi:hypothetical protein
MMSAPRKNRIFTDISNVAHAWNMVKRNETRELRKGLPEQSLRLGRRRGDPRKQSVAPRVQGALLHVHRTPMCWEG